MISSNALSDLNGLYSSDITRIPIPISTYSSSWNLVTAGATKSYVDDVFYELTRYSLKISPSNTSQIVIELLNQDVGVLINDAEWVFHCMIKCNSTVTVTSFLYDSDSAYTSVSGNSQTLRQNTWTACYSNINEYADINSPSHPMSIRIHIDNHGSQPIYISFPTLTLDKPFLYNLLYTEGKVLFPDFFQEYDSQETNPTYPFFKLWHSLTSNLDDVLKEYLAIFPYEQSELPSSSFSTNSGGQYEFSKSTLTTPGLMPDDYRLWAAMFIGTRLQNEINILSGGNLTATLSEGLSETSYEIGDTGPGGGKVFITPTTFGNSTGRYFEVAPVGAQVQRRWAQTSLESTAVTGADGTAIGTGYKNTLEIIAQGNSSTSTSAAKYCRTASLSGGLSDWFLPSQDELAELYTNRVALNTSFTSGVYWSSTETAASTAKAQHLSTGTTTTPTKLTSTNYVRPVRSFAVSTLTVDEFKKWQLESRAYGYARGSSISLRSAGKQVLVGTQKIISTPFWDDDPFHIHMRTVTSETPGALDEGYSSPNVLAAVEPMRPQGFIITHATIDEITFILGDVDFGVFDQSVLG